MKTETKKEANARKRAGQWRAKVGSSFKKVWGPPKELCNLMVPRPLKGVKEEVTLTGVREEDEKAIVEGSSRLFKAHNAEAGFCTATGRKRAFEVGVSYSHGKGLLRLCLVCPTCRLHASNTPMTWNSHM